MKTDPKIKTPKALILFCAIAAMLSACRGLAPEGVYRGDQALYQADQAIVDSYDILHAFVKWEYQNRESLEKWPEIRKASDHVRDNAQRWLSSAVILRAAYAGDRSTANRTNLETSLMILRTAVTEAAKHLSMNPDQPRLDSRPAGGDQPPPP